LTLLRGVITVESIFQAGIEKMTMSWMEIRQMGGSQRSHIREGDHVRGDRGDRSILSMIIFGGSWINWFPLFIYRDRRRGGRGSMTGETCPMC